MDKSVFSPDYEAVLRVLVRYRKAAGFTQVDLAETLGRTQSSVSKLERGALRLDIIQLRSVCKALGVTLVEFVQELEEEIKAATPKKRVRRAPRKRKSSGK